MLLVFVVPTLRFAGLVVMVEDPPYSRRAWARYVPLYPPLPDSSHLAVATIQYCCERMLRFRRRQSTTYIIAVPKEEEEAAVAVAVAIAIGGFQSIQRRQQKKEERWTTTTMTNPRDPPPCSSDNTKASGFWHAIVIVSNVSTRFVAILPQLTPRTPLILPSFSFSVINSGYKQNGAVKY